MLAPLEPYSLQCGFTSAVKGFETLPAHESPKPRFVTLSSKKHFRLSVRQGGHVSFYAATLQTARQCCPWKSKAGNAAATLLFQKQRCKRHSNANFSNATLKTRPQCCFFKSHAANVAEALFFPKQRWKRASSVGFSKATLRTPQQCCFCKFHIANL